VIFAIESPQSSRAPHFCVSASPLPTTKARLSISPRLSFSSGAVQRTALNCVNSFFFTFLRTLLYCAKSHLLSFHAIPHSLQKTWGVGTPPKICLVFSRVYALLKLRPSMPAPILSGSLPAAAGLYAEAGRPVGAAVGVPLEPRCATTENAPYPHSVHIVARLFLSQRGGYTPPSPYQAPACPACPDPIGDLVGDRSGGFYPAGAPFLLHGSPVTEHGTLVPLPARAVISRRSVVIFVLSLYRSLHRRFMVGDCASAYSYARKSGVSSLFRQAL